MRFYQEQPDYDRYWIIENDVRFGGDWSSLFEELAASEADLLCTTVQTHADNPDWAHWHTLTTAGEEIPSRAGGKGLFRSGARHAACSRRAMRAIARVGADTRKCSGRQSRVSRVYAWKTSAAMADSPPRRGGNVTITTP